MSNQVIKIVSCSGWESPTVNLLGEYSDDEVEFGVPASPGVNDPTLYSAAFNDVAAGRYRVLLISGGKVRASDHVTLKDADGDYPVEGMQKPGSGFVGDTIRYDQQDADPVNKTTDVSTSEVVS